MRKKVILMADNDAEFLKNRSELLEEHGYSVRKASTPDEAASKMQEGGLDLAILDIRLADDKDEKDVSGLKLAREVARSLPKIIMTEHPDSRKATAALKPMSDGLPAAVEFHEKRDGPEGFLEAVRLALGPDLLWLRNLRTALAGMDEELASDYRNAQIQANLNYRWALVFAITGAMMTMAGIALAYWFRLEVVLVSTLAGLVNEMIGYLFYRRVDKANIRMDHYHHERMQGQRFDILLKSCEGLEAPAERQACQKEIILATLASWMDSHDKPGTATQAL